MIRRITLAFAALAATTAPAFAHLDPLEHGSFMAGLSHPLFGLDHILVMIAVGLWAAQIGGRAMWAVPAAFVATMAVGFGLAVSGIALPFVVATRAARFAAFALDYLILSFGSALVTFLIVWIAGGLFALDSAETGASEFLGVLWMLFWFIAWNGYFMAFELGPRGALVSFHDDKPPNVDGLLAYVARLDGVAKLRPDSKLVITRAWNDPKSRLNGALQLSKGLAKAMA